MAEIEFLQNVNVNICWLSELFLISQLQIVAWTKQDQTINQLIEKIAD